MIGRAFFVAKGHYLLEEKSDWGHAIAFERCIYLLRRECKEKMMKERFGGKYEIHRSF